MDNTNAKRIFITIFLIGLIILCYYTNDIVKPIAFSIFVAYILNPVTKFITSKGINKRISALISILGLLGLLILAIIYIIPAITKDVLEVLKNIDNYSDEMQSFISKFNYEKVPAYLRSVIDTGIIRLQTGAVNSLNEFLKGILDFTMQLPTYALTPVFIYYFLVDSDFFINIIKSLIPISIRTKSMELGHQIDNIIGNYIKSQLILSLIVSVLTFIALLAIKIKYPIMIALINGIANIIPYFGPILGLIPAFLLGLTESLNKALMISVLFFIIQQFESMIITPKLMGESLGIHPVFIMIVLLLGGKFFGAWGLILAVPAAGAIKVTYKYVMNNLY